MGKNNPLRVLLWEATLKCNAFCKFCGSRCGEIFYSNELSTKEICNAFNQIADRYDASQIMVNVTGGEPLMRGDLIEVMNYATSLGFHWGLVTNGILLNEDLIVKLKSANLKTIAISIDGLYETHDSLRGIKNGLKTVIRNLNLLKKEDFIETIMITTVVSKRNIEELDSIKELLKTLPVHIWRICPVDPIGRACDDKDLLLEKEQTESVYQYIVKCRNESLPFQVITSCSHYLGKFELKTRTFHFQCNAGKTVGSILANGDIFVCTDVPRIPELIQGNVRNDNFVDVWENRFEFFRNNESRHTGKCSNCINYSLCQADSMHTWNFEKSEPNFCMLDYNFQRYTLSDYPEKTDINSIIQNIKGNFVTISDVFIKAQSLSKDKVYITPTAVRKIVDYFEWGTQNHSIEKICALMGHIYRNNEITDEAFIICVEDIIFIESTSATEDTLILDESMEKQINEFIVDGSQLLHIGFVHSHPNELSIAMSIGDYTFHKKLYEDDWRKALNIIINPQKKHIAAYAGPAASHVELHLLGYNELLVGEG